MPPKRVQKPAEPTDRVTRNSATTSARDPEESTTRPESAASNSDTVTEDGPSRQSGRTNWSDLDTDSNQGEFHGFEDGVDNASTQNIQHLLQGVQIPEVVDQVESPTEFETQFFGTANEEALDMADTDDDRDEEDEVAPVIPPLPVIPGMSPEMLAFFQMQQAMTLQAQKVQQDALLKAQAAAERRQDRLRRQESDRQIPDARAMRGDYQQQMKNMTEQIAKMATTRSQGNARPPTIKLPTFDIDKDKEGFQMWKGRWDNHLKAHRIHTIADEEERSERMLVELHAALSDETLKWITHREFTAEQQKDAVFILAAMEEYIKDSTNPLVQHVELNMMARYANETADHFWHRVNDKLNLCAFDDITDYRDHQGMMTIMRGVDNHLRRKMILAKADTYAKVVQIMKEEERASQHLALFNPRKEASVNATSSYKQQQKSGQQAAQTNSRGNSSANGGYRGGRGQDRGRGQAYGAQRQEDARSQSQDRQNQNQSSERQSRSQSRDWRGGRGGRGGHHGNNDRQSGANTQSFNPCYRCNKTSHDQKDCWAKEAECYNCDKKGHIAPACRAPKRETQDPNAAALNGCLGSLEATTGDVIACATSQTRKEILPMETLEAIKVTVAHDEQAPPMQLWFLPDTGANVTAVANSDAVGIPLSPTAITLRTADGKTLETVGTFVATLSLQGNEARERIHVVRGLSRPLLSRQMLKELGLIHRDFPHQVTHINAVATDTVKTETVATQEVIAHAAPETGEKRESAMIETEHGPAFNKLVNEFKDLFDGQCTQMKSPDYHIEVEDGAKPVSYGACRSVADPYMPALKRELDTLVNQGIIEKINYATPWLHPIVVVPKKGTTDIRLCVDFSKLNKFVIRPVNPQPTPWETVRNLPRGIKHFAVFDALKGYHQIPLADESKDLTAFMTPFGRFRYLRLAFGLNSANDVFTLKYGNAIDKATEGLRATEDTLVRGSTSGELIENTRRFFDACRENGITLNLRKIQWDKKEVLFAGFLLDPTGYRLDPALNKALLEFPTPTSPTDVRSFFGLANQLCNFSDEIADLLSPMKSLLKKGVMFQFLPEHEVAFKAAREHLASTRTLAYYCPRRMTRLVVDASRLTGLGFVLKQQQDDGMWKAVQAGSRFLTSAETRYAMIESHGRATSAECLSTDFRTVNFRSGPTTHRSCPSSIVRHCRTSPIEDFNDSK